MRDLGYIRGSPPGNEALSKSPVLMVDINFLELKIYGSFINYHCEPELSRANKDTHDSSENDRWRLITFSIVT
jgi:hypothetical protein